MIHTSDVKPNVFPHGGTGTKSEIDRLQDLSASIALNRTKIKEVGTDGTIGWKESTPNVSLTLRQLEYGNIEFYNKLANKADNNTIVNFTDFKTSYSDIACYKTEESSGDFLSTVWYPKTRVSGFSLSIGDPEASLERNFSLVGEDEITLQGNNQYLIYIDKTIESGEAGTVNIVIGSGDYANYPDPVEDPDVSGSYILRVVRVRAGVISDLVEGTGYSYTSGTTTIALSDTLAGDVYRIWYSAATYIVGALPFVTNTTDEVEISADCCSIYLATSNYVYRLQSVSLDVSLDRTDYKEIGNKEIVLRGARDITANVTLGRFLESYTVEEILRGVSSNYGKIDVREFPTTGTDLIIKIFSDNTKSNFLLGYKVTGLNVTSFDKGTPVDDYETQNVSCEGTGGVISSVEDTWA